MAATRRAGVIGPILFSACGLYLSAASAADAPLLELDVVAVSKLNASKEHCEACAGHLRNDAVVCFGRLAGVASTQRAGREGRLSIPNVPIKDGAARHRLLIEHTGTVALGAVSTTTGKTPGGEAYRVWTMDVQSQGTLQFRLMKWDGARYTDLQNWSVPVPRMEGPGISGSQVEVARVSGVAANMNSTKLPTSPELAKLTALMATVPGNIRDLILSRLISVAIGAPPKKDAASAGAAATPPAAGGAGIPIVITVENKTPWPVKSVESVVLYQGKPVAVGDRAMADGIYQLEFPEPLRGGQKISLPANARPSSRPKPGVYAAVFAAAAAPAAKPAVEAEADVAPVEEK